ncbi:MAG: site-specific integrase [Erysipelotrichaceae bacterium]|nr:site-specific integrase [Erysipelotrichaceae bacterium]
MDTIRDKTSRYNNYLDSYFGDLLIADIDREKLSDLSSYIQELESVRTCDPLTRKTMYRIWSDVMAMMNYAYEEEIIPYKIEPKKSARIKNPKSFDKPESWTRNEFDLFIDQVDDETEKTIFYILAYCGLRKSEMRGLKFENVDANNKTIYIRTQFKNKKEGDRKLKTVFSKRSIEIPDMILQKLLKIKQDRMDAGVPENKIGKEYCFVNKRGEVIPAETLRRHYKGYIEKAGVRNFPMHNLRHYFATYLISKGASVPYVQDRMGHSRNDMTILRFYASVDPEEIKRNMERINKDLMAENDENG